MPTIAEKIKEIEDEIRDTPYNKASQHHIGKLKAKLAKLKDESMKRGKRKAHAPGVKKTGDATVALIGFPSVGKSTLLNRITDAASAVGGYDFTTVKVIPGMLSYKGARIQVFDLPGLIEDAAIGKGRGREVLSMVRVANLILFMVDVNRPEQLATLVDELYKGNVRVNEIPPNISIKKTGTGGITISRTTTQGLTDRTIKGILSGYGYINAQVTIRERLNEDRLIDHVAGNRVYIPGFVLLNKMDMVDEHELVRVMARLKPWSVLPLSAKDGTNIETLKRRIYRELKFIRIYLRPSKDDGKDREPLIMRERATVNDVCCALHRDFARKFRYALIWGASVKFPGQRVGPSHELRDGDVLKIIVER